jgi:hypothetical protein
MKYLLMGVAEWRGPNRGTAVKITTDILTSHSLYISNLIQPVNDGSTASKERITAIVITG